MSPFRRIFLALVALLGSGIAWVNLSMLLPGDPNYHATWWKVAVGLVVFAACAFLTGAQQKEPQA
jgi:uncharacterized membrane protein YidH (DUF202 family)